MSLAPTGAKMRAQALSRVIAGFGSATHSRVMAGLGPATHDFAMFVPTIAGTQAPS
jgi:hypothetical protein